MPDDTLKITGTQAGSIIRGEAAPGSVVEAINLSTIPTERYHTDDTFELARADASGRFDGHMKMRAGDLIRMRLRKPNGSRSDWLTIRAAGMGSDTRNAQVALFRINLSADGRHHIELSNINSSRPISEPGAKLLFVNERTGKKTQVVLDDNGTFAPNTRLRGRAGDTFSVRASDGTNNANFTAESGKVTVPGAGNDSGGVDLPDPALHKDELKADGTPRFQVHRYRGPLFVDGVKATDVKQGSLGNCYMPSAVAAIAAALPDTFEKIMTQNDDGTYTVTFKEYDWRTRQYSDKKVTVDGDLYARSWGGPLYGSSDGDTGPRKMEMWWPILEKAFAAWKGSYNTIGSGGSSSTVMSEILGRRSDTMSINSRNENAVWDKLTTSVDSHKPVSAGTHGESQEALYANTGVYADHSYTVLGYETKTDGGRFVKLRNPWGESEPYPGDGRNDGIFLLPLEKFAKLYSTLYTVE